MPTQLELKRRDNWEQQLKVALINIQSLRQNFHIYDKNLKGLCQRYRNWLERVGLEPQVNMKIYEDFK